MHGGIGAARFCGVQIELSISEPGLGLRSRAAKLQTFDPRRQRAASLGQLGGQGRPLEGLDQSVELDERSVGLLLETNRSGDGLELVGRRSVLDRRQCFCFVFRFENPFGNCIGDLGRSSLVLSALYLGLICAET